MDSTSDRLPEIKERLQHHFIGNRQDAEWLIREVERLREREADLWDTITTYAPGYVIEELDKTRVEHTTTRDHSTRLGMIEFRAGDRLVGETRSQSQRVISRLLEKLAGENPGKEIEAVYPLDYHYQR